MKEYTTDKLRNVVLLGHNTTGKTTFSEALLFAAGGSTRAGKVDDGTTISDYDDEEKRRKQSINLSIVPIEWKGYKINLIDTPGYSDYIGEAKCGARAADLGLIFVDAVSSVEVGTELAMQTVEEANIPRAVMISRMDRDNADYERVLSDLHEAFHSDIVPLIIPVGKQASFSGVIDLLSRKYLKGPKGEECPVPADMVKTVEAARERLVEAAAEGEDDLIEKYFAEGTLSDDELIRGLRSAIRKKSFVPVLCCAPSLGTGVGAALFSIINYAPMPFDLGADPDDGKHGTVAYVFKTSADPFVGKVSYFRVIEGPIHSIDNRLLVTRTNTEERMTSLHVPRGKDQLLVPTLHVGDLGVVTKLGSALTGDTLCDKQHGTSLPPITFPNPLLAMAIHPKSKNDTAKLSPSLTRLCEEDPSLKWHNDPITHETVLMGMGQSHIEVAVHHLHNKFGVDVETTWPKVPYRETIMKLGQSRYRHKKQSGGAGQFGEVEMSVEPSEPGAGYEFGWKVFGGAVSSSYQTSIEKGIKQVMERGVIAGYPIYDVRCVVLDGKEHAVDSKPIAFEIAARNAFREAFAQASPVLLEPIYRYTIHVPDLNSGDVMSHLKTKRAQVVGMEQVGNKAVIIADAPLAEMQKYGTDLRSLTQGRGRYDLQFQAYAPMPHPIAATIIAKHKTEVQHEEE